MATFLLDKITAISAKDYRKRTALHLAAEGGIAEMIKMLISKGANVACADELGRTPLHYAAQLKYAAATKQLMDGDAVLSITYYYPLRKYCENQIKRAPHTQH